MPKKKIAKKSKKTVENAMARDIRHAVQSIPSMIVKDIEDRNVEVSPTDMTNAPSFLVSKDNQKKRQVVWGGVAFLATLIFFVWFLNTRMLFQHLQPANAAGVGILNDQAKNFDDTVKQLFSDINQANSSIEVVAITVPTIQQNVQATLQQAFAGFTTTSTSSSTTPTH